MIHSKIGLGWFWIIMTGLLLAKPVVEHKERMLYEQFQTHMRNTELLDAIAIGEKLQKNYLLSPYEPQLLLDLAYAYFLEVRDNSDDSYMGSFYGVFSSFRRKFPDSPNLEYLEFLEALIAVKKAEISTFSSWFSEGSYTQKIAESQVAFQVLHHSLQGLGKSRFGSALLDEWKTMYDRLAHYHLFVAQDLFEKEAYVGAVNRCVAVLTCYPRSSSAIEALKVLSASYEELGFEEDARIALEIFKANERPVIDVQASAEQPSASAETPTAEDSPLPA